MLDIAWFSTARGPTSRLLLQRVHAAALAGSLDARISFVFCNREHGEAAETDLFLDLVDRCGIPLVSFSSTRFRDRVGGRGPGYNGKSFAPWREAYDREVLERIGVFSPQIALLAGYMLVMTPPLCRHFTTINLHPAPPGGPIGTWQQVIWQLIGTGAGASGAYMHLVTPELDLGPTVTYCTYAIQGAEFDPLWDAVKGRGVEDLRAQEGEEFPLFRRIREEGVRREVPLILESLGAFSAGEVAIREGRPVDRQGRPTSGHDLTSVIDSRLLQGAAS